MRNVSSQRKLHSALTGFVTTFVLTMVSSPVAGSAATRLFPGGASVNTPEVVAQAAMWDSEKSSSPFVPEFFDGGGYGPTAETAVRQAIEDAEVTASAYGRYTCELAGEPTVFQQPPGSLRAFRAQVRLHCTP
jgi:hypothetical protein